MPKGQGQPPRKEADTQQAVSMECPESPPWSEHTEKKWRIFWEQESLLEEKRQVCPHIQPSWSLGLIWHLPLSLVTPAPGRPP